MKKSSLSLAISVCLSAGVTHAGGAGDFTNYNYTAPAKRLIISTDQTIASPNLIAFTNELSTQADATMSFVRTMAIENSYVYEVPILKKGAQLGLIMAKLKATPGVVSVEEDIMLQPMSVNDPSYDKQWHYFEDKGGINLPSAWEKSTGQGTVVAVLDTGIIYHDDLTANLIGGYDFISDTSVGNDGGGRDSDPSDPGDWVSANECYSGNPASGSSWHGTHVAGTIAAVTNNRVGVAGVAYDAKIVPVRVLGKCGGSLSDISDAIVWASGGTVRGVPANPYPADVINMSLGGQAACSSSYQTAINQAVANGTTVVVAAGNSNDNASRYTPASCDNVVTVASTTRQGNRAYYSNYGSTVDVAAPGGETRTVKTDGVLSTLNAGSKTPGADNYDYYQGTSMAAPHVAGVVALMKSAAPSASPAQIESALKATTRTLPGSCSGGCGTGIVDASAAIDKLSGNGPTDPAPGDNTGGFTESGLSASRSQWVYFSVDVPAGVSSLTVDISGGSGDADLHVRRGTNPTSSSYECRPYKNGNTESCVISRPASGSWKIGIRAYSAFSGVTLNATWQK